MNRIFETPWKIRNQIESWLSYPLARLTFATNHISWKRGWRFHGLPIIMKHRNSEISFGEGLGLRSSFHSNPLAPNHPVVICTWQPGAILQVGKNFAMTGGTLCAAQSIIIGDNVAVGANSVIADTDFHPVDATMRAETSTEGACAPIIIEDDVFVGMNCIILKSVHLGTGCVIGAGSVVTHNIRAGWVAGGNPAREIHQIDK
jgi:acetyltransferase-like isoleucine patch superfamily enzyme